MGTEIEIDHFICVDPSIRRLGVAYYEHNKLREAYLLSQDGKDDWRRRAMAMCHRLCGLIHFVIPPDTSFDILTEIPENWQGERGVTSRDSEAVQKLYYFVGLMAAMLPLTGARYVSGVTPTRWKGQIPKRIMIKRGLTWCEEQDVVPTFEDDNVMEAILLGKYFLNHSHDIILPYITLAVGTQVPASPSCFHLAMKECDVTMDTCF